MDASTVLTAALQDGRLYLLDRSDEEPPLAVVNTRAVRGLIRRKYVMAPPEARKRMLMLAQCFGAELTPAQLAELL